LYVGHDLLRCVVDVCNVAQFLGLWHKILNIL
jgi:hypothetical protein